MTATFGWEEPYLYLNLDRGAFVFVYRTVGAVYLMRLERLVGQKQGYPHQLVAFARVALVCLDHAYREPYRVALVYRA